MLGVNDADNSVSGGAFQANIASTVGVLQANNCVTVLINPLLYSDGASDNNLATYAGFPFLLTAYPTALAAVAANNPSWAIHEAQNIAGQIDGNTNQYGLHGGIHPNTVGQQQHGYRIARAVYEYLNPSASGGGAGGSRIFTGM